jgi:hypothetical protein
VVAEEIPIVTLPGEESGSRVARMPTLATMRLSRRWGTRFCDVEEQEGLVYFLYVEFEEEDVAVFDYVFFAFGA